MGALGEGLQRLRSFFKKPQRDSELDAEVAEHLELAVEENIRRGMTAEEARRQAFIRFGGVVQAKEQQREARGLPWLDVLLQDLRFTFRTLGRDRGFTVIAAVILGLGIGANVTVFSVVNTLLLRPLPLRNPQELVRILSKDPAGGESSMTYSADATEEFQRLNRSFESISGYYAFSGPDNLKLMGHGQPLPVTGLMVGRNFFHTLGVEPALGRVFTAEECLHNSRPVVLLSHAFWKRQYGGDRSIVGQAIDVNATPVTVIGVLPESFDFGSVFSPGYKVDMYGPVIYDDIRDEGNTMALVGRLKPGVSLAQAQAEADLLFPTLHFSVKHPEYGGGYTGALFGLKDRQAAPFVDCVVVRGGPDSAHRVREPVEFASGARGGAQQGICHAHGFGCYSRPVAAAVADGEPHPFVRGRFAWPGDCFRHYHLSRPPGLNRAAAAEQRAYRCSLVGLDPAGGRDCGGFVRFCSGPQNLQRQLARVSQRLRPWGERRQKT
jgi:hypothetical protein